MRQTWLAVLAGVLASGCGGGTSPADAADAANAPDAPADAPVDAGGGFPGFGEACLPILQQGDQVCATGLVCVSVGAQQGQNLCTKTCTTSGAACAGAPAGTSPTCGRVYQVPGGDMRVCEFFCEPGITTCPPRTSCVVDLNNGTTCQP